MVPSERSLVDLGKGKTTTLVGVLDMEEIVVEIVVGRISTRRLVDGSGLHGLGHGVRRSCLCRLIRVNEQYHLGWWYRSRVELRCRWDV